MTAEPAKIYVDCASVYHTGAKQTLQTEAYQTIRGNWWCLSCRAKRDRYEIRRKEKVALAASQKVPEITLNEYVPPVLEILPVEELPLWKVTVVQPTVHQVRAKDFLDAATQVSDLGEIIKVERV
jgi:hypothetical protein